MPKKLDKSRGFGEVVGHEGGAFFEQDGVLFDAEGVELFNDEVTPSTKTPVRRAPKAKPVEAISPVEDQLTQQLQGGSGGVES